MKKPSKKREYRKLVFCDVGSWNTGMTCKLIKNKKEGRLFDIIEVEIKGYKSDPILFRASPEEALAIAWGMIKSVYHFLMGFEPYHKFRMKSGKSKFNKSEIWWSI